MVAFAVRAWCLAALSGLALAGHNDMFQCRSKSAPCPVTELTDSNWASEIGSAPHFIMFYAPWCGHCKVLAPKLKKAAAQLSELGLKVGAVDVEPNRNVQGMFSDIKGFPTLKLVMQPSNPGKTAISYDGPREADDIARWTQETAARVGVDLAEPVAVKQFDELYTFFGRAALDNKPVLFAVGADKAPPDWFSKLNSKLTEDLLGPAKKKADDPEAEAKRLLREAHAATKLKEVKQGIDDLLMTMEQKKKAKKGKPIYVAAYSSDPAALVAFNVTASSGQASVFVAALDRKNLALSAVVPFGANPIIEKKRGKELLAPLKDFAVSVAQTALAGGARALAESLATAALPDLPKPKSVLAAEERAAKKKASAAEVGAVASKADLDARCYGLPASKTCALLLVDEANTADFSALAGKYAREGFAFSTVAAADAPAGLLADLKGDAPTLPALVIVKGGKRPRAARASGDENDLSTLIDAVLGGQGKFDKFPNGLPTWPEADADATDDYDL